MSFEYESYLLFVFPVIILFFYMYSRNERMYFQWIEDHWFLKRSKSSKISSFLFYISMFLLLISLLDLRGPQEKVNTSIPDQKTVILIDKSASMLVEDVRPNRFKKAVMMARHFVKRAAGHQISIVVFSETHKRVVPFTDDIDLLDSILGGLLGLDINNGGSELSLAMKEATSYFALDNDYKGGNLLVFTDGEEHDSLKEFNLSPDVNLAIVGIGTLNGGPIPLRRKGGSFLGYKKFQGKEINSKLNEVNIKRFINRTNNSKYWISLSYSLPTDEILDFFRSKFQLKLSKGETQIRPVLAKYIVIPAVVLYLISFLISLKRTYVPMMSLFLIFFLLGSDLHANEGEDNKPSPQDIKAASLLMEMKKGEMDATSKLKIAEELLRLNKHKESSTIYSETIKNSRDYPTETLLNMGTSLLKAGKIGEAIDLFEELKKNRNLSEDQERVIENNTLKAILNKKQKQKQKQKEKNKKDKKDKKNEKKNKQGENKDSKEGKGKDKKNKDSKGSQGKDEKSKKPSKGSDDGDDEKKKDKKKDNGNDSEDMKNNQKKTVKEKEDEIKKKRKMVKVPATLKQLMNDDRGLRKKYLKTSVGKDNRSEKRDW